VLSLSKLFVLLGKECLIDGGWASEDLGFDDVPIIVINVDLKFIQPGRCVLFYKSLECAIGAFEFLTIFDFVYCLCIVGVVHGQLS
jgi:hypothetical protein